MKLTVRSGNGSRVLDAYALPSGKVLVDDCELVALTSSAVTAAKRAQWTAARCAAWRAAHGGAA